ncbi:RNA polymerase sigma factor [Chitinophaga caseinilytica]|uniref:Sigma-70 family RNA polymerase sigma factor n=1 Tax=Chitinophaga caseinilytica TaxID=2267521 RepID=A0ABZ2Z0X6_9BACT
MISVLCSLFGAGHVDEAEDIVSETFLAATESWSAKGVPENPAGWLYTVAKHKTLNWLKRNDFFQRQLLTDLKRGTPEGEMLEIDLSERNVSDSQLAMMFTVCHPSIPPESQVALALSLLCGFGAQEIADAYLTTPAVIYKRLSRGKEKLKEAGLAIRQPTVSEINDRIDVVLKTIYLLFSEGYFSSSHDMVLRRDLCVEAMRLCYLLLESPQTDLPAVNALMALMCFHASRFDARVSERGEMVLYQEQDESLWNRELIEKGEYYLYQAATVPNLSTYHLEAAIAWWHTHKADDREKWENILDLYNQLLILQYSPMAALNRTYAIAQVKGKPAAIREAEKLALTDNHFYYALLGNLYTGINDAKALQHYGSALQLAHTPAGIAAMEKYIAELKALPGR